MELSSLVDQAQHTIKTVEEAQMRLAYDEQQKLHANYLEGTKKKIIELLGEDLWERFNFDIEYDEGIAVANFVIEGVREFCFLHQAIHLRGGYFTPAEYGTHWIIEFPTLIEIREGVYTNRFTNLYDEDECEVRIKENDQLFRERFLVAIGAYLKRRRELIEWRRDIEAKREAFDKLPWYKKLRAKRP